MKKIIFFTTTLFLLVFILVGCSSKNDKTIYKFERTNVIQIETTTTMKSEVSTINIKEEDYDKLFDSLDELELTISDFNDNVKGYEFYFRIIYENENEILVSLLGEELVNIDGTFYETSLYNSNNFIVFFE